MNIYFPGKDYPDREEWLKLREAQREKPQPRVIHSSKEPLMLGINRAKLRLDANKRVDEAKNPAKRGSRGALIEQRHKYYRRDK